MNGLSDTGVRIEMERKHAQAMAHAVTLLVEEVAGRFPCAQKERGRSKVGRMARLKGAVETAAPRMDVLA